MPTLTREEAYELAWSAPMRDLAKRFGLTDVGLKKILVGNAIPVPPQGHWNKVAAGKPVFRIKLPPRKAGAQNFVHIGHQNYQSWYRTPEQIIAAEPPREPIFAEAIGAVRDREANALGRVRYISNLDAPTPDIRKILAKDDRRRAKAAENSGLFASFYAPLFESRFERRRLQIINSIGLALARWGGALDIRGEAARELSALGAPFRLDEICARPERSGEWKTLSISHGVMKLTLDSDLHAKTALSWMDGDKRIEHQLTDIVLAMIVASEEQRRVLTMANYKQELKTRIDAKAAVEKARKEAEKQEREQLAREREERLKELLSLARAHREAVEIRALVAAMAAARPEVVAYLSSWSAWALEVADELDPTVKGIVEAGRLFLNDPGFGSPGQKDGASPSA